MSSTRGNCGKQSTFREVLNDSLVKRVALLDLRFLPSLSRRNGVPMIYVLLAAMEGTTASAMRFPGSCYQKCDTHFSPAVNSKDVEVDAVITPRGFRGAFYKRIPTADPNTLKM